MGYTFLALFYSMSAITMYFTNLRSLLNCSEIYVSMSIIKISHLPKAKYRFAKKETNGILLL